MIELESGLGVDAVLARVREAVPTPWQWRYGGGHERSPFYGKVKAGGFWIMKGKNRSEKNSFNPVLVAHVAPTVRGSRITANVRIPLPIQVFLAGWCVGVVVIGGWGLYDALTSGAQSDRALIPILGAAIPVFLCVGGILFLAAHFVGKQRRPELEKWLRSVVEES